MRMLGYTCLSPRATRLSMATLLASGALWTALPVRAANFDVGTDAQLRSAISSASNGDTITFTASITLGSNLPIIEKNLTFNGGNFTLSGNNLNRGLFVKSGSVAVNDLTIANAVAQGGNGGIPNNWGGGGGGGAGLGGALFVGEGAAWPKNLLPHRCGNIFSPSLNPATFCTGWPCGRL